jgi:hypothetical protein
MEMHTLIGIVGMSIILVSFILSQLGKWSTESRSYDIANAIGSATLIGYAYILDSWPFFILNTVWFLVSIRDVLRSK